MSAPNGAIAATLDELRKLGRGTSTDLAARMGAAPNAILTRLRKLEADGKIVRTGSIPTRSRPIIVWGLPRTAQETGSIEASNSAEFEARGGVVEVLPGVAYVPPALRPMRLSYRGSGSIGA